MFHPALMLLAVLLIHLSFPAQEQTPEQKQAVAEAVALLDASTAAIPEVGNSAALRRLLNTLPPAYARAGQPQRARDAIVKIVQLVAAMRESENGPRGMLASLQSNAVLQFANLGYPADAAELAAAINDGDFHWSAVATAVYGYTRVGDLVNARRLAASIPQSSDRDMAYQHIAYECTRLADFDCARAAVDSITEAASKTRPLVAIAQAQARQGRQEQAASDLQQARSIVEDLPASGMPRGFRSFTGCEPSKYPTPRDEGLRQVAESQAGMGELHAALDTLRQIQDVEVRDNALVSAATNQAAKGAFGSAQSLAGEVSRPECRAVALSSIVFRQFVSGDAAGATQTLDQIPVAEQRARTLTNLAATRQAHRLGAVESMLAKAGQAALQVSDPAQRLQLLLYVANRQMREQLTAQARSTLLSARIASNERPVGAMNPTGIGSAPNQMPRNWYPLLSEMVELLAETGAVDSAADIARQVGGSGPYPVTRLARGAGRGGQVAAAQTWAASLPAPEERALAKIGFAIGILDRANVGTTPADALW